MVTLEARKDSKRITMLVSHFLPEGEFPMVPTLREMVYLGMAGKAQVKGKNPGEDYIVEPGDFVYMAAGDEREIYVPETEPATILVTAITD